MVKWYCFRTLSNILHITVVIEKNDTGTTNLQNLNKNETIFSVYFSNSFYKVSD